MYPAMLEQKLTVGFYIKVKWTLATTQFSGHFVLPLALTGVVMTSARFV